METIGEYNFEIFPRYEKSRQDVVNPRITGYYYDIRGIGGFFIYKSPHDYETEQEARDAAIWHINSLDKG